MIRDMNEGFILKVSDEEIIIYIMDTNEEVSIPKTEISKVILSIKKSDLLLYCMLRKKIILTNVSNFTKEKTKVYLDK